MRRYCSRPVINAASIALLHMGEVLTLINVMTQVEQGNEQLRVSCGTCERCRLAERQEMHLFESQGSKVKSS